MMFKTIKHDEFKRNGKTIIVNTALLDDVYEVMILYPMGREIDQSRHRDQDAALAAHEAFIQKYIREDGLLENVSLSGRYLKLSEDLKAAHCAADAFKDGPDDGTCNFDAMYISLPGWNKPRIRAAAKQADLMVSIAHVFHHKVYMFQPPHGGQGERRTKQAEAMYELMKSRGYEASVYYRMD